VFTASTAELLETAVTGASSLSAQFEPLVVPEHPLDVLCQQLLGMAAQRSWSTVAAFEVVRRAYPYRNLSWTDFADCVDYLSGTKQGVGSHFSRHHDGEKNDSRPLFLERLHWHEGEFSIADDRTARLLRRNIGSILTEPTRPVRMAEGEWLLAEGRLIGHVEEAFADRLQPGDRFLLDGRCLEFRRIEKRALLVEEAMGQPATPRWQGNGWPLSADLARRLFLMRSQASEALREGSAALDELLRQDYGLEPEAAEILATLFERQESVSEVPDALTVLVEVVSSDLGTDYYVHTSLNRAGNDAVARVAVLRLARNRGRTATSMVADLGFLLCPGGSGELTASDFSQLLLATGFDRDLDEAIAKSVTLRERFRCTATTGLMLLRNPLGKRRRVGGHEWAERRLFDKINALDPDFVLLRQARREIAAEVLDAAVARRFLEELPLRTLRCRRLPDVSPLAEGWTQAGAGPAEVVDSPAEALEKLHAMLMTQ